MKKKSLKQSFVILLGLTLSACAGVKVKDAEFCADMGPLGASCFHSLSEGERDIPYDVWRKLEVGKDHAFGMICTQPENYKEWKSTVLKFCSRYRGVCRYEFLKKLDDIEKKLDEKTQ